MISCLKPLILINPAVYEAVAFSHKIVCNDVVRYYNGVSRLYRHSLYTALSSLLPSITQDNLSNYYTFDRFNHTIGLFLAVPCRDCLLCLQSDENQIAQRLMLESESYIDEPYFVTLTFGSWSLPKDNNPTIRHIQTYIGRLRDYCRRFYKTEIRFYAQGEHGKKKGRAHFHLLVFGLPTMPHETALRLFSLPWRTKKWYTRCERGKLIKERLPIGNVYVSQINDPHYRAYYESTKKRPLNPADGLRYCCKYSSKHSVCRTWSHGLGKRKASSLIPILRDIAKNSFIRPDWTLSYQTKYGTIQQVSITRWLLQYAFKTFNRSTYYYRKRIYDYVNYYVANHSDYYDNPTLLELCKFVGVHPYELSRDYCKKSFAKLRQKYSLTSISSLQKWLQFISKDKFFDRVKQIDCDFLLNETKLYRNFCELYFGLKPEITVDMLQLKANQRIKYINKSQILQTL